MMAVRYAIRLLLMTLREEWRIPVGSWGLLDLWVLEGGVSRVHHMLVARRSYRCWSGSDNGGGASR